MTAAAIIAVAAGAFLLLTCLLGRRSGKYVALGIGPVGGGTAMIAVGGVLVAKGVLLGALLDLVGVLSIWAAFRTLGGN